MANYLSELGLRTLWGCFLDYLDEQGYVLDSDSRLTDARTPTAHTHTKSQITDFPTIPTVPTAEISANTSARHTHSNKSILDGISKAPLTEHQALKTINNQSIVGSGNIDIQGGGGVATAWELIGTTTGTTAITIDTSNYDELLLVHKGQVSASATKYDSTVVVADDIGSNPLDITMGGISTSTGGYGCNAKLSKTSLAPQWVYNGGSSVTSYVQNWKVYGRKTASEVIINGEY